MPWHYVLLSGLVMVPVMGFLWVVQRVRQNAVLADIGFCVGFGLVVLAYAGIVSGDPLRRILVGTLGSVYAFRLAWHLYVHRFSGVPEDPRYQTLRRKWGRRAQGYFLLYFLGQALALAVFSIPPLVVMANPEPGLRGWDILGLLIGWAAVGGEALADGQLTRFKRDPRNGQTTCRRGLWRYSRHPNYFFESVYWWSYVVMAVGIPDGWMTLVGPLLMMWGLLKVTGIPLSEAQALARRGEDYRDYQRKTSALIPWFPQKPENPGGASFGPHLGLSQPGYQQQSRESQEGAQQEKGRPP